MEITAPGHIARLASTVYLVKRVADLPLTLKPPYFDVKPTSARLITAERGFRLINRRDAFAIFARGSGDHGKKLFAVFRGTETSNYGVDIITDLRAALAVSATGETVHAGFNQTFNSLRDDLQAFVDDHQDTTEIHCVGHSLGGAIATLAASWLAANSHKKINLYTFGCPRVGYGSSGLATHLPNALGVDNIKRVYHGTDPVTMVPVFPFAHAPHNGRAYYLPYTGIVINPAAHRMDNYIVSVGGNSWRSLYRPHPFSASEQTIEHWLQSERVDNLAEASVWEKINTALAWILQKLLILPQAAVVGALTLADQLAMMLQKGLILGGKVGNWTFQLIRRLMRSLGMKVVDALEELTISIIRLVLNRVLGRIANEVKKALRRM